MVDNHLRTIVILLADCTISNVALCLLEFGGKIAGWRTGASRGQRLTSLQQLDNWCKSFVAIYDVL